MTTPPTTPKRRTIRPYRGGRTEIIAALRVRPGYRAKLAEIVKRESQIAGKRVSRSDWIEQKIDEDY